MWFGWTFCSWLQAAVKWSPAPVEGHLDAGVTKSQEPQGPTPVEGRLDVGILESQEERLQCPATGDSKSAEHLIVLSSILSILSFRPELQCASCNNAADDTEGKFQRCSRCHTTTYCSQQCQKEHWDAHKVLCSAIHTLDTHEKEAVFKRYEAITNKQKAKLVKLVGRKCLVTCHLNSAAEKCLWDTGAMVSLISESWLKKNHPDLMIKDVSELLEEYPGLNLEAANGSEMPFSGWVEIELMVEPEVVLRVPFLVTNGTLTDPIIGNNVIETIIETFPNADVLSKLLPGVHPDRIKKIINAIKETAAATDVCSVSMLKKDVIIPAGEVVKLSCKADAGYFEKRTPLLFEPDERQAWPKGLEVDEAIVSVPVGVTTKVSVAVVNSTKHDIKLQFRASYDSRVSYTVTGNIQTIQGMRQHSGDAQGQCPSGHR